ncbi:MAG TPA: AraC family transcriptional regulator [Mycobacteriales bacterium]|nr:AraC family transcriptional regulator [Mycobacteriales bacterium]
MATNLLQFQRTAAGRPYHAALVPMPVRPIGSDRHGHADFYELMGIVAGRGEQHLVTGSQELRAGDVALVRPGDQHAISGLPPHGMEFINIAFPISTWREFLKLTGVNSAGDWDRAPLPPLVRLRGADADRMMALFRRVLDDFHRRPSVLQLVRFWVDLVDLLPGQDSGPVSRLTGVPDWLSEAHAAMHRPENLRGGIPTLLTLSNVSHAHLSRCMRTHYGITPGEFVAQLRLGLAATLLTTTPATVTAIAYRCGFSSPSYFTRCFHAAHGISPRAFREHSRRAFVP